LRVVIRLKLKDGIMSGISNNGYFDAGSWNSWKFCYYDSAKGAEVVDQAALDQYLDQYAQQMLSNGMSQTTISFAQVDDIAKILKGDYKDCNQSDSLYMLDKNVGDLQINGKPVFDYMVQRLSQDGLKVFLAFGGQSGTWNFNFGSLPNDPSTMGKNLADWAKSIGLSGIDFDAEYSAESMVSTNGSQNLAAFFSSLHSEAHSSGMPVSWTVMGDSTQWGFSQGYFADIFNTQKGGAPFNDMFDGLNLMLYNGQYYLNAENPPTQSWDLGTWIKEMAENTGLSPTQCASMLHVGFDSALDYSKQGTSGGPLPYDSSTIPSDVKTSGQYAAYIMLQLQNELQKIFNSPDLTLGTSFSWDDNANYNVPINPQTHNCPCPFFSNNTFEQDFYNYLKSHT
jgi:hypothetical protein